MKIILCFALSWIFVSGYKKIADIPVIDRHLVRPCPNVDLPCLSRYFGLHSSCKPPAPAPNVLSLANHVVYVPYYNATLTQERASVTNLHRGVVVDFLVDKNSNEWILSLRFDRVRITGTTKLRVFFPGEFPVTVNTEQSTEIYPTIITTTMFEKGNPRPSLRSSTTMAHIPRKIRFMDLGTFNNPTDPYLKELKSELIKKQEITLREMFLTRSQVFATHYIQSYICDYDININDNNILN